MANVARKAEAPPAERSVFGVIVDVAHAAQEAAGLAAMKRPDIVDLAQSVAAMEPNHPFEAVMRRAGVSLDGMAPDEIMARRLVVGVAEALLAR